MAAILALNGGTNQLKAAMAMLCLVLAVLSGQANGAEWKLVTGDEYPPFSSKKAAGGGLVTIVVKEAFAAVDAETVLDWRPWSRGYRDTVDLRHDATFPYIQTPKRQREMLYSDPVLLLRRAVFVLDGRVNEFQAPASLHGKVYCNPQGYGDGAVIRDLREQGKITRRTPQNIRKCFELLIAGQVDFVAASEMLGQAILSRLGGRASGVQPVFLEAMKPYSLHVIVSNKHPRAQELLAQFNKGLQKLRNNGRFQAIIAGYDF